MMQVTKLMNDFGEEVGFMIHEDSMDMFTAVTYHKCINSFKGWEKARNWINSMDYQWDEWREKVI